MVAKSVDRRIVHDNFQTWRRRHEDGFILRFTAKRRAFLHKANCRHFGDWDVKCQRGGHSLTSHLKVCDKSESHLIVWAEKNQIEVARCPDCLGRSATSRRR